MPPFVGWAVKVTKVPAQIGFWEALIEILTANTGFTVIETWLEVAGLPVAQVALEVREQVIRLPFDGI